MVDEATRRQIAAADPDASTWLSANAGSGKTKVLTDRVARLFLKGVPPQNILCLTYTKAAASEMQNRLYKRLGEWAMLPDRELESELSKLGADTFDDTKRLGHARTLFARAVEAPGGLRIQTIHSFCSSLLRRFPTEAGISPAFRELDDADQKALFRDVLDDMASAAPEIFKGLSKLTISEDLDDLIRAILGRREKFAQPASAADIWQAFGLTPGLKTEDVLASVFLGGEADFAKAIDPYLRGSDKTTDHDLADLLSRPDMEKPTLAYFWEVAGFLLFGSGAKQPYGAKTSALPTKDVREANPGLFVGLHDFMNRVEAARDVALSLDSAEKTLLLWQFAERFVTTYERLKFEGGYLDFDDLIAKTIGLLSDPAVSQWVLFRLDGSIDHILVDEAQDTSPDQWRLIELLAQEIGVGKSARENTLRTVFVVGDTKQSIYSFQGADPREFTRMKRMFAQRLDSEGRKLESWSLDHSFRSSEAILRLVDEVLHGNSFNMEESRHIAFHDELPGRVDIWPIIEGEGGPGNKEWYDPTDMADTTSHQYLLAERIAKEIGHMQKTCSIPGKDGFRPVSFGDFLILVRGRSSGFFHEIIRACKKADLPIAGADRLKLGGEIAVKDMIALLSFLNTPDDDLSLASVLRSPLFDLSEDDLFRLASGRGSKTLWLSLFDHQELFPEAVATLVDLREKVDFASPYQLLERVLNRFQGRRKFLDRLGVEAEEGMDALIHILLSYEARTPATLTGFLEWYAQNETEIKRQPEAAGDRIRIMTVHGAKGLEAPIVILPETGLPQNRSQDAIVGLGEDASFPVWKTDKTIAPQISLEAVERAKLLAEEERFRLLYVAMTRAEKWLIVCGSGDQCAVEGSWYSSVDNGMRALNAAAVSTGIGDAMRLQHGDWEDISRDNQTTPEPPAALPLWAKQPARAGNPKMREITATGLGGEKVIAGPLPPEDAPTAASRGTLLHKLLEVLPGVDPSSWPKAARRLAATGFSDLSEEDIDGVCEKAVHLLGLPDLADVFAPGGLPEVDISAPVADFGGAIVHGTIDRMIVSDDAVWIVDFKSNAIVPKDVGDVPEGILRQLGAYARVMGQIYPEKAIRLSILWTNTATLMDVAPKHAIQSYSNAPMS